MRGHSDGPFALHLICLDVRLSEEDWLMVDLSLEDFPSLSNAVKTSSLTEQEHIIAD